MQRSVRRRAHHPALVLVAIGALGAFGCGGRAAGAECEETADCREGLLCVENGRGGRQCMQPCMAGTRLCEDGSVCLSTAADGWVCWLGGRTAIRRPCIDSLACEPGTVCAQGVCHQACTVGDDTVCDEGQRCRSVDGTSAGVCTDAPLSLGALVKTP